MKNKIEIIPAVMPNNFQDLTEKIDVVADFVQWIQIDVMDKKFVNSLSWPYGDKSHFEKIQEQEEGLPHWQDVNFSIDLMVLNPEEEAPKWVNAGASEIIIHIESLKSGRHFGEKLNSSRRPDEKEDLSQDTTFLKELKESSDIEICLALATETPITALDKYEGFYDSVQFMGIDHIGYQGQEFNENVLDKIRDFRSKNPEMPIGIDGGVNFENIEELVEVGATRIVSGSAIFESVDISSTIREMKNLVGSLGI